ncbi:MAG TPA: 4-hydroxy-3-methylbut-2-enyl diphosphate reductase [Tepidisphaeraceae bacterium]|nr:4-hydroxy-3-methylbut-2-enyl diphosphate reductase [Tepidisphaeraceae bacterium]
MKIILANPRGFCAGVNMAIDCVDEVLKIKGAPVYVFHEIVHNRHVVEDFRSRGVKFVEDLADVPVGGVLVYSAHGVSPEVRKVAKERSLVEVDATCPLVTKVHLEVLKFAREGYRIVFIGHKNHDEAVGTVGEAPGAITIVETEEDVAALEVPDGEKVAYVTQTTLSVADAGRLIAALKKKYPKIKGPPKEDICYATTNRQAAVSEWSEEVEVVLVVGSQNSSNSRRLVETARELGREAHLIDDEAQLEPGWVEGRETVLITAGASAPDHLVQGLVRRLEKEFGGVVETRNLVKEDVAFELPRSLKRLAVVGK